VLPTFANELLPRIPLRSAGLPGVTLATWTPDVAVIFRPAWLSNFARSLTKSMPPIPGQGWMFLPVAMGWGTTPFIMAPETAKLMPELAPMGLRIWELTPTTLPLS